MIATGTMQKVQLIDGEYSPLEASDALCTFINDAINFNKTNRLRRLIGNEHCDTHDMTCNIDNLVCDKKSANDIIADARRLGQKVEVKAILKVSIIA